MNHPDTQYVTANQYIEGVGTDYALGTLPFGHYKTSQQYKKLYTTTLQDLSREMDRLSTLAMQGNHRAAAYLKVARTIFFERVVEEEAALSLGNGTGGIHFHNNVTVPQTANSSVSPIAAFGIGASLAAVAFFVLSGLAALVIVGLIAAVLIGAVLLVAVLHRERPRDFERFRNSAPQCADALSVPAIASAVTAKDQDILCLDHKPGQAMTAQEAVAVTPLVRQSTAVSSICNLNKSVKACK